MRGVVRGGSGRGGVALELNDGVHPAPGRVPRWRSVTRIRVVAGDEVVVVGIVERGKVGRGLGRGRAEVGRPADARGPALTFCERDGASASQRSATKARDRVSIDARATRVGKEMDGVRAGGRTPVDDPSAGDASRRRARAYLLSFARVRNVLEVVTRPRGSLATRSAMRAGRASRRGVRRSSRVCRFTPDPYADAEDVPHEYTWRSGLIFSSDDDDVSESRFVNRQTGPSLRPIGNRLGKGNPHADVAYSLDGERLGR